MAALLLPPASFFIDACVPAVFTALESVNASVEVDDVIVFGDDFFPSFPFSAPSATFSPSAAAAAFFFSYSAFFSAFFAAAGVNAVEVDDGGGGGG